MTFVLLLTRKGGQSPFSTQKNHQEKGDCPLFPHRHGLLQLVATFTTGCYGAPLPK
jgi:hypothetical protein